MHPQKFLVSGLILIVKPTVKLSITIAESNPFEEFNMHLFRIVIAVFAILIAGCNTPEALKMRSPSLDLSSLMSAKRVAACISQKWQSSPDGNTQVKLLKSDDVYSLSMTNQDLNNTVLVADVKEDGGGSRTRYVNGYLFNGKKYDRAVIDCQMNAQ